LSTFRARSALLGLVAAIVAILALWPAPAESAEGFLDLNVEPQMLDVPKGAGRIYWRILSSPPPQIVADEPFKSQLKREIDTAFAETEPWVADRGSDRNLTAWLAKGPLAAAKLIFQVPRANEPKGPQFVAILRAPTPAQGRAHIFVPFTYELTLMSRLRIVASSAADPPPSGSAVKPVPLPTDLLDPVPAPDRQAVASSVTFELRAKGPAFADGEEDRLLKVARHAFVIAREQHVLPPRPVVDNASRDKVEEIVRTTLIPHPEPARSAVRLEPVAGESGLWRLAVTNVVPIEAVKIEARYDLAKILGPETTVSAQEKASLEARAAEIATDLEERFKEDFAKQRGTVLTAAEVEAIRSHMRETENKRIAKVDQPRLDHGVLIYPIVINPTVKTLVGSVGVGYAAREGLTGSASLTGTNLLGWSDSGSFNLKGGPDARRADFNYGIPLPSEWLNDNRLSGRLSLRGLYARTTDTVLGQPRNAAVTEDEHGVFLRQSFMFLPLASRGDGRPPATDTHASWKSWGLSEATALGLDVEFGRRDVDLRGVAAPDGVRLDGVTAPLSLTLRGSTGFEPRDRTGQRARSVDLRVESTFERSFAVLGSDLSYERWDVRGAIDGMFWLFSTTPRNDVLLRYVHGYGTATAGTPLFRFLRVGGESNVRGVEEGEFIGRRLSYQQLEVGLGLCSLYQLVAPKIGGTPVTAPPAAGANECQVGGLDFGRAFVKTFVDHADLTDRAVGRQFQRGSREIFGAGIALELHVPVGTQKLSLTVGYAYSPDSDRHSSGTAFTQVIMPFAVR